METGSTISIGSELKPGMKVIMQGATGELHAFADVLGGERTDPLSIDLWSCLVPGINRTDYGSIAPGVQFTTFMASPDLEPSIASGRTQVRDIPYSEIAQLLETEDFDLAILHVAPADAAGNCSFGVCADIGAIVWPRAKKRIAFLNPLMPCLARGDALPHSAIDIAIPLSFPLVAAIREDKLPLLETIGRLAAELVPDGAIIQSGIGRAPGAVIAALVGRRCLSVRSGLITPEYRMLAEAGALDTGGEHIAGIAYGDADFYAWLGDSDCFQFRSIHLTHGAEALSALRGFFAVNSALEADLSGSVNLEWRGGKKISSVGGAPDYARAAHASLGGRSIIVLPATTSTGASRIIPTLNPRRAPAYEMAQTPASIDGALIDTVVTEHGIADLKGKTRKERAEAMILIAAPQHRDWLTGEMFWYGH